MSEQDAGAVPLREPGQPTPPDTESIAGLGDQPVEPILSLPPLQELVAGYPLSARTGEPARNWAIIASVVTFCLAATAAVVGYWWYWWQAIHITNFSTSAQLLEWFDPRPGSASSIVLVCVLAALGLILTAGPGVAAYNAWHGASFSRTLGLVAVGTSLLALLFGGVAWLTLPFAAIGAALLWVKPARDFFKAWASYANPQRSAIVPFRNVDYGPAPRFAP